MQNERHKANDTGTAILFKPPFTVESATRKVQMAEDAWNSRDPERVSLAYSPDSQWRNRTEFLQGREEIKAFLQRKWAKELDYRLKKTLWTFGDNRIAVTFEYEWHDAGGQWYRSYGNELWEFDDGRADAAAHCEHQRCPDLQKLNDGFAK